MPKLLIVDDEPLVSVGIESMIRWSDYGISLCRHAFNGKQALEIIEEEEPDLVITDIRMPVMDGLQMIRACRETNDILPLFILLTVHEDFSYAKEAIACNVFDYLVKLDLTPDLLGDTMKRAVEAIKRVKKQTPGTNLLLTEEVFKNKFFIYLLHNLFESKEQFELQAKRLKLTFPFHAYTVTYCRVLTRTDCSDSILSFIGDSVHKSMTGYVVFMDPEYFCILFCYDREEAFLPEIKRLLSNIRQMTETYFHAELCCATGKIVEDITAVSLSYQTARLLMHSSGTKKGLFYYQNNPEQLSIRNTFHIGLFRRDFTEAFEEFSAGKISVLFKNLIELFSSHPDQLIQAIDVSCSILHLSISLLPDGQQVVWEIFADEKEGYLSIHNLTDMPQVLSYLSKLGNGLCEIIERRRKVFQNHIVNNIKKYVSNHVFEHIAQKQVAAIFGITPNYLSILFRKYNDVCFIDYVNKVKIDTAKELLCRQNLRVYEAAEKLGYSNEFYFSKVFKSVTGISPRDYIKIHGNSPGTNA